MSGPIERVIVRLAAAVDDADAIVTAARLAARAPAPLHAVFVEDEELLHLAELPFACQVTPGAGAEPLTRHNAGLHLRAAAERARRRVAAAATLHRIRHSFETVRGSPDQAAGTSERDLVVGAAWTRPLGGHIRLAARWWLAIDSMPGAFLLSRRGWATGGRVVMLLRDRGAASGRLLQTAAQLAHAAAAGLTVIGPAIIADAKGFQKWLADRVADASIDVAVEIAPANAADLQRRIAELDCRLLGIEAGFSEGSGERLRDFVERFACDVLIVR